MRRLVSVLVSGLVAAVVVGPSAASAVDTPIDPARGARTAATTPRLVGLAAASHPGFDRVVWTFTGGLPGRRAAYVPRLLGDASGLPVRLAGDAVLLVTFSGADAHDATGTSTAARRLVVGLPNVIELARSGDFEAVVTYGVGLAKAQPFHLFTLTNPNRVVLDVRKDYGQVSRTVAFADPARFAAGTPPFTRLVRRVVPSGAQASALMNQLMAGPTNAERARGIAVVRSGAGDFDRLQIDAAGTARLRLLGGCSSGGSTFTVANLIVPTLKALASVDHVKIYDPAGRTERPLGRSDSIPTCLEP